MSILKNIKKAGAIAALLFISNTTFSAPPPPPSGPTCWPPPCGIPVDGGLGFLLAAGIVYGGKKIYNHLQNPD